MTWIYWYLNNCAMNWSWNSVRYIGGSVAHTHTRHIKLYVWNGYGSGVCKLTKRNHLDVCNGFAVIIIITIRGDGMHEMGKV